MIDIIIPIYNSLKTIDKALSSILTQLKVNVKVYLIDDNSDEDYTQVLNYYNSLLDITYIKLDKNYGPGYARKVGLEKSNSKYITFLDSDDILGTPLALNTLYNAINENEADITTSTIYEELDNGYRLYHNDNIGLHGKIYRRSFIEEHNITFPNTRVNEDTYFNALMILNNAKFYNIDDLTYYWCNNKDSICRKDVNKHYIEDIISYSNTLVAVIHDFLKNHEIYDIQVLKTYLSESIVNIFFKYYIAPPEIKDVVYKSLLDILNIYLKYDEIDNIDKNIANEEVYQKYLKFEEQLISLLRR